MPNKANLFPLQCPKCGGPVEYVSQKDDYVCPYCGTSFKYTAADARNLNNRLKLAREAMNKDRYKEALRYYREALDFDPDSWEASLGVASCTTILSTPFEYSGQSFNYEIADLKKQIISMYPDAAREAKLTLADHMMLTGLYCNNTYLGKLLKAWERYDDYEMSDYDDDWDDDDYDDKPRHRSGYADKPDVTVDALIRDVEEWLKGAADLVLEAVPADERLDSHQINIVEIYINYVKGYDKYVKTRNYDAHKWAVERCERMLKQHNPEYTYKEKYNLEFG